jgi:hypothetical protein
MRDYAALATNDGNAHEADYANVPHLATSIVVC